MREITAFEPFVDGASMPSYSALSPSGRYLAYAVEQTIPGGSDEVNNNISGVISDEQEQRPEEGGADDDAAASSSRPQYKVAIARSCAIDAVAAGRAYPKERFSSSRKAGGVDPDTCPVTARVTALQWLDESHLACGLHDGTVTIIVAGRGRWGAAEKYQEGSVLEHGLDRAGGWTPALSRCFHRVQHGHGGGGAENDKSRVMCIRLSGGGASGAEGAVVGSTARGSEPTAWVLYPDRVLVCVGVEALITLARQQIEKRAGSSSPQSSSSPAGGPTENDPHGNESQPASPASPSFAKLQLEGQDEVLDVAACSAPAGLFEVRPERHSHVILASGLSPALAFYPIGSESRSFGLASIAWAVASRVTSLTVGALDGLFGFVGLRGRGRKAAAATAKANRANGGEGSEGGNGGGGDDEGSPAPLVLRWDGGLQDGWRRVSRLCLDPSGRLAAAADGFGRVMLVDCSTRQILRMWKGVRDAECGWLEIVESWEGRRVASVGQKNRLGASGAAGAITLLSPGEAAAAAAATATPVVGLYLAILAPLRGRVELWRMRHGPCVRVVPAPAGARLLTSRPSVAGSSEIGHLDGAGRGRHTEALTSCYLLSGGGDAQGAGGSEATKLLLSPLVVEEGDLADLPNRFSREPTVDDAYRLRKFAAAVAEMMSANGGATAAPGQQRRNADAVGERRRLPLAQEAREDVLFELLSKLESVESLVQATALLGGGAPSVPSAPLDKASRPRHGAVELSVSFQRKTCALCRERADQAAAASTGEPRDKNAASTGNAAAVAALRFRAAAFELYTVLERVKLNPAGEDEDENPAFLPRGRRGWKHAALCEEAAGWADAVRGAEGAQGAALPSAELPEFQEFLETVTVVLEAVEEAVPRRGVPGALAGREKSPPQLLRFVTLGDANDHDEREPKLAGAPLPRRNSRDPAAPIESPPTRGARPTVADGGGTTAGAVCAVAGYARCRTRLAGWLFRPLLSDAFALASLTEALSLLGLGGRDGDGDGQAAALIRDMASWFLALPVDRAADTTVKREAQNCQVFRWLKTVIHAWASPPSSKRLGGGASNRGPESEKSFLDDEKATPAGAVASAAGAAVGTGSRVAGLFDDPVDGVASPTASTTASARKGGVFGDDESPTGTKGSDAERPEGEEEEEGGGDADDDGGVGSDENDDDDGTDSKNVEARVEETLRPMFEACAASRRLENAAMLSVVTAEALAACREKLEESSLGQVAIGGGEAWVTLARRLRLCLFVDHRLHWGVRTEQRDRASVRHFLEGKASVYALIAKDQLMSFQDLTCSACSVRERAEVEASARSQREAAEARAAAAGALQRSAPGGGEDDVWNEVAAASSLADAQMDEQWRAVQAIALRAGSSPTTAALGGAFLALDDEAGGELSASSDRTPGREKKTRPRETSSSSTSSGSGGVAARPLETPPTTLFFMRSHAQPIILACHRTRWLVLSWASTGPPSAEALQRATDPASVAESARAVEAAVRRLSLAVDHLSYLRTARPFLAGCIAYWLWEHGGVRAHVGRLARGFARGDGDGDGDRGGDGSRAAGGEGSGVGGGVPGAAALVEEGRPAREAFLAAAEEFLKVEALFLGRRDGHDRGVTRRDAAGRGGGGGKDPRSDVSFMSLLTKGAMQRCPWPGAWDRWVEESLRDAQVHPPLQPAVGAHSTLLRALRVNTVCGLREGETLGLFGKGHKLCAEASLRDEQLATPSVTGRGRPAPAGGVEQAAAAAAAARVEGERGVVAQREAYIRRALDAIVPRPAQNVYRLARDFGVSEDTVRGWHCLVLLRRGHDVLGEEALSQVFSLQDLAGDILTVMRLRLKRFLSFLESSPRGVASRGLLASLDADTCQWVRSARDTEAAAARGAGGGGAGGVQSKKEAGEPLRSTHGVLLCLARALPRESRHKLQANALVTLVGTMLQHLGGDGGAVAGYRR